MADLDDLLAARQNDMRAAAARREAEYEEAVAERKELERQRDAAWMELKVLVAACSERLVAAGVPTLPIIHDETERVGAPYNFVDRGEQGFLFYASRLRRALGASTNGEFLVSDNLGPFPAFQERGIVLGRRTRPEPPEIGSLSYGCGLTFNKSTDKIMWEEEDIFEHMTRLEVRSLVLDATAAMLLSQSQ